MQRQLAPYFVHLYCHHFQLRVGMSNFKIDVIHNPLYLQCVDHWTSSIRCRSIAVFVRQPLTQLLVILFDVTLK